MINYTRFRIVTVLDNGEFLKGLWIEFNNLVHKGSIEDFVNYANEINSTAIKDRWFLEFN